MKSIINVSDFEWDGGNLAHCAAHGVSRVEIEALLRASPAIAPDLAHSDAEDRFLAVGRTLCGRALFVAFTFRVKAGKRLIRPISARYMHRKEAEAYEKNRTQAEE